MSRTLPERKATAGWVQTDRRTHEAWGQLTLQHPAAAALLHYLASMVGDFNAVVISQPALAAETGLSVSTVKRAVTILREGRWIEVRQIGRTGTANAYVLNDRVAWFGPSIGKARWSLFSATVFVSADEQPDKAVLGRQEPLNRVPRLFAGEGMLPSGVGLPPPTQPFIDGLEPEMVSIQRRGPGAGESGPSGPVDDLPPPKGAKRSSRSPSAATRARRSK